MKVKNFGIWIRYDSRSGTHNMYKEFRELSRADAVKSLYQDMAARHRARFRSIHVRLTFRLYAGILTNDLLMLSDPSGCRDRKERGCPSPIHQATAYPASPLPSPSSCTEESQYFRRSPAEHLQLECIILWRVIVKVVPYRQLLSHCVCCTRTR